MTEPPSQIRDVYAHTFVGHADNVELRVSGAELKALLDELLARLRTAPAVAAAGPSLELSAAQLDALRQFMEAAPGASLGERESQSLVRLCIDPTYRRWQRRYVALSGGYRQAPPELEQSYSTILVRGEGPQRQIERVPLADIREALARHRTFVLLAQPGAGKTTVLQRIALDKALARLRAEEGALLPLFARMASQQPAETPPAFLARVWQQALPGVHADATAEFTQALKGGRLCILADALNEARREGYADRMHDWADFARELPAGNRLVFSCRTLDYAGELGVQQVEIDPLSHGQVQDFARRYLDPARGDAFWSALSGPHADLLPLAEVPYYLLMLVDVYAEAGELPGRRVALFVRFVAALLQREREKRHPVAWIEVAAQHLALGELAYAMQHLGAGTEVDAAWAANILPAAVTVDGRTVATPAEPVLALARGASLLAGAGGQNVRFAHHLLQEYFAAEALLRHFQAGDDAQELAGLWRVPSRVRDMPPAARGQWDPLPGPPTTGWEETTILAAGLYPDLVDAVQATNPALAARCLLESGAPAGDGRVAASRQALLGRLDSPAIHLRSRIEAGLLLGRLGDPRFTAASFGGVQAILPPVVAIAGGRAAVGSGWWDRLADPDEKPRHAVTLAAYALGRYPVTNAEYACFVDAGGYEDDTWWTAGGQRWLAGEPVPGEAEPGDYYLHGWQRFRENPSLIDEYIRSERMTEREADQMWRILITWPEERVRAQIAEWYPQGERVVEPRFWRDAAFDNASQPVVGICWYEAVAYARWLAALSGLPFRLPSEPEWEWAARRGSRLYPWGWRWNPSRLNSLEGGGPTGRVMRTTPVGAYPQGATRDGIHDLAGNVWEWTATRFAGYPYAAAADLEDWDATGLRVARGGGWGANRKRVRCASRNWNVPWIRFNDLGMRLARTLS